MDLESRDMWEEYSRAKDEMFRYTHTPEAPWYTVEADEKRRARLNCISHVVDSIEYEDVLPGPIELKARPRSRRTTSVRRARRTRSFSRSTDLRRLSGAARGPPQQRRCPFGHRK